jgi:hypothetical protein
LFRTWRQRQVAQHIAEYEKGNFGKNRLNAEEKADQRRSTSQRKRKLIDRVFGRAKLDHGLRQVKRVGLQRVDWFYRLAITAFSR